MWPSKICIATTRARALHMASCCKAGVQAPPTEADDDAGIAGLPFMQTEHEDEHEEWIDWAAVEQQAGGGGGSSS